MSNSKNDQDPMTRPRYTGLPTFMRAPYRERKIGIITGLFDRKSEYRIRSVAWLFDERGERYND